MVIYSVCCPASYKNSSLAILLNTAASSQLTPHQLQATLAGERKPLVLDVREYPEFAASHLKEARLVPLAELERRTVELPKDALIVCVCRSGRRSAEAAEMLKGLRFAEVSQLAGGMMAWEEAGLPVEKEARAPWALERQVRLVAGILILLGLGLSHVWPPAIVLAWFVPAGLVFAAITDSCAMGMLLAKLPWNSALFLRRAFGWFVLGVAVFVIAKNSHAFLHT